MQELVEYIVADSGIPTYVSGDDLSDRVILRGHDPTLNFLAGPHGVWLPRR